MLVEDYAATDGDNDWQRQDYKGSDQ